MLESKACATLPHPPAFFVLIILFALDFIFNYVLCIYALECNVHTSQREHWLSLELKLEVIVELLEVDA